VKPEKTSTSSDGQPQSAETQSLKLIYEEPGLKLYFLDVLGELSFHIENDIPIDRERLDHLHEVFTCLLFVLGEKGMDHLDTWIPPYMDTEIRFAESFGFQRTGFEKILSYANGSEQVLTELRINF
jgi:hypothetical protein